MTHWMYCRNVSDERRNFAIGSSPHGKASTMQSVSHFHASTWIQTMMPTLLAQCVIISISSAPQLTRRRIERWPTLLCFFTGRKPTSLPASAYPYFSTPSPSPRNSNLYFQVARKLPRPSPSTARFPTQKAAPFQAAFCICPHSPAASCSGGFPGCT